MSADRLQLPMESGAYRWFYADVVAPPFTAVFIFMIGSLFSPRYSAALRRGGRPLEHCAVNFALYENGARWLWVLTEYPTAAIERGALRIGQSSFSYEPDGRIRVRVVDRTAPWGKPTEAALELVPRSPAHEAVQLVAGQPHYWQPVAARAQARLELPQHGLTLEGNGYHDMNFGEVPLGQGISGWQWTRVHRRQLTSVSYRCAGEATRLHFVANDKRTQLLRWPPEPVAESRTAWGLKVPRELSAGVGPELAQPRLLESSPFYARSEAAVDGVHALGETADFARFHSPYVRWMAHFRTRVGSAA